MFRPEIRTVFAVVKGCSKLVLTENEAKFNSLHDMSGFKIKEFSMMIDLSDLLGQSIDFIFFVLNDGIIRPRTLP